MRTAKNCAARASLCSFWQPVICNVGQPRHRHRISRAKQQRIKFKSGRVGEAWSPDYSASWQRVGQFGWCLNERSSRRARLRPDAASSLLQKLAARAYWEMMSFWV
jgi:hypothetical protein